jgi:hypothetical protein
MGTHSRVLALGVAAIIVAALYAVPAGAGAAAWSSQSVPPQLVPSGGLTGVSCPSAAGCAAVGAWKNPAGLTVPLAKARIGGQWINVPVPNPAGSPSSSLSAVSCTASGMCMAVGSYTNTLGKTVTLAEESVGTSRFIVATLNPAGASSSTLSGVSCPDPSDCVAVGHVEISGGLSDLIERWNGSAWSIQTAPVPAGAVDPGFSAVSCSSARACTAVGSDVPDGGQGSSVGGTLAERWDGQTWSAQNTADPAGATSDGLSSVSCPSSTSCTTVGSFSVDGSPGLPLAEHWDGTAWTLQPTPGLPDPAVPSGELNGVSCTSSTACVAVGQYENDPVGEAALIERWDGTSWTVQAAPNALGASVSYLLTAVSCTSSSACTAVGTYQGVPGPQDSPSLIENWNGTAWSAQRSPDPLGLAVSALSAVSCSSPSACAAVGGSLAERWNGSAWSIQPTAVLPGAFTSDLSAVSCTSPTACIAAGGASDTSSVQITLAEVWNGTAWAVQPTPHASGVQAGFRGVSCTAANACTAVGFSFDTTSNTGGTLAERWNGTSWTVQATPSPGDLGSSVLSAVSCTSSTSCTAVGGDFIGSTEVTLAERWDGTSWTVQPTPNPASGPDGGLAQLTGVSCTSSTVCTAVGSALSGQLVERWNGTVWAIQTTPAFGHLASVSCTTSTSCTAVGGSSDNGSQSDAPVAEHWDGTSWTIQPTPTPPPAGGGQLNGASCTAGPICEAVGAGGSLPTQEPVAEHYG